MDSEYKYLITEVASSNIRDTVLHIRDKLLNPTAAHKLYDNLIACFHRLCSFPDMGAPLVSGAALRDDLRYCYVDNYIVIYFVNYDKKLVSIASVKYARSELNDTIKRL